MSAFKPQHITVSEEMRIPATPEAIWPQLCPSREYDWIETWDCELVHSESGYNELGCVFRTDLPTEQGKETWVTSRFDPYERIEFVRTNDIRTIHFVIELVPDGDTTLLRWTHNVTTLNEDGNTYLKTKPETFRASMKMLERMLTHYLQTGEMLRGEATSKPENINHHVHRR